MSHLKYLQSDFVYYHKTQKRNRILNQKFSLLLCHNHSIKFLMHWFKHCYIYGWKKLAFLSESCTDEGMRCKQIHFNLKLSRKIFRFISSCIVTINFSPLLYSAGILQTRVTYYSLLAILTRPIPCTLL